MKHFLLAIAFIALVLGCTKDEIAPKPDRAEAIIDVRSRGNSDLDSIIFRIVRLGEAMMESAADSAEYARWALRLDTLRDVSDSTEVWSMLIDTMGLDTSLITDVTSEAGNLYGKYGSTYDIEPQVEARLEYLIDIGAIGESFPGGNVALFGGWFDDFLSLDECGFVHTAAVVAGGVGTVFSIGGAIVTGGAAIPVAVLSTGAFAYSLYDYVDKCVE